MKKGDRVTWHDPDNGELLIGVVKSHIVGEYWETTLQNSARAGLIRHVVESDIISVEAPATPKKETQLELFA